LRAARWFAKHSQEADHDLLRRAIDVGSDRWTQDALKAALASLHRPEPGVRESRRDEVDELTEGLTEKIYSEAVEETTAQLVHELEPVLVLGVLKVLARKEIPQYETSQTFVQILRLERILAAIDALRRAASSPNLVEVDLAEIIRRVAETEKIRESVAITFGGPRPFIVLTDQALVELALANGIRNALESAGSVDPKSPIVISWGDTDRDYWVAVLDEGRRFQSGASIADHHT
jgi:hypothetical protein